MQYFKKSNNFYFGIIFFIALSISTVSIILSFPTTYYGDEGAYYNQAKNIMAQGINGFQLNADVFLKDPILQLYPPPIRIAHVFFAAIALKFSNTFIALSYLSLIFFIAHCIICFFFIKKYLGATASIIAGLLICFSPLSCGLAGRALSESGYYLFLTLSLFTFINYLSKPGLNKIILFILFFSLCILIKESAVFIMPFFCGILILEKFYFKKSIAISHVLVFVLCPLLVSFCIYLIALGDIKKVIDVFIVLREINIATPHAYIQLFNSGPWYQYFVDYFMLSPFISLLFFFFAGYYFTIQEKGIQQLSILFFFFVYFFVMFSFLPKNVRYAQPLDLIYRISTALMIIQLYKKSNFSIGIKKVIFISSFALILLSDFSSFRKFFIINKIYDPVSYNLLKAENFFGI